LKLHFLNRIRFDLKLRCMEGTADRAMPATKVRELPQAAPAPKVHEKPQAMPDGPPEASKRGFVLSMFYLFFCTGGSATATAGEQPELGSVRRRHFCVFIAQILDFSKQNLF